MFENTLELAENKLLLLYIFKKIKFPISNNQITEVILENDFINYFTLQQYLNELLSSNFIKQIDSQSNHKFIITKKGIKVLSLFGNRISKDKIDILDNYIDQHFNGIKSKISVNANYTTKHKNSFMVNLKISESNSTLMNLKLNVDSKKTAQKLCEKWEKNFSEIYYKIVELLMED
ncbi:DUF4364 family protein [Clostridium autoethanogenum]|uniref:DUF4364 family protein n=1 Tax=Clostridium autoethanogenum DSM 10061 TaxID=1341692 RepID=A0ABN4BDJ9_9CLOT|nr:DUF4364 family protein [Clostridium autoethanogenum]AGY75586.1 DUF4364 family protein [Clostridium autoethanogenum DSM 10061]ALU35750.1 Hypothetical protein CLAU_1321 [Clostridium autoethanogenum DSM 10061]OVY52188.1 hypothetical protein WX72_01080 [Clostridium autoethanogenum]